MTLGQVYDLDLRRNEQLIKEVVTQAQGEVRHIESTTCQSKANGPDGSRRIPQTGSRNLDVILP